MKFLSLFLILTSLNTFAAGEKLQYTQGPDKGKDVTKETTYFGSYDFCFKGNGYAANKLVWNLLDNDYEKASSFSKYNASDDVIVYGYVDTKCTDEGASDKECRSVRISKRCK